MHFTRASIKVKGIFASLNFVSYFQQHCMHRLLYMLKLAPFVHQLRRLDVNFMVLGPVPITYICKVPYFIPPIALT